jgi:hypothetical protein
VCSSDLWEWNGTDFKRIIDSFGLMKSALSQVTFPEASEEDWYRVERSLGEHLRDVMQKKQEKNTPLLPKSDS